MSGWDDEDTAALFGFTIEQVAAIRVAMQGKVLEGNSLLSWEKRQPKREDSSTDRTKKYRDRKSDESDATKRTVTQCDATKRTVTLETETETEKKEQEQGAIAPLSPAAADDADVREAEGAEPIPDCPHAAILDLFADKLPELPQPRRSLWVASKHAEALRSRWRWVLTASHESGPRKGQRLAECEADGIAWFGRFFEYVGKCPLLMGSKSDWRAELGWLVKRDNFAKVIQGNYEAEAKEAA